MAKRRSVSVPPPKKGFIGNYFGSLEKYLQNVPDRTIVTVTQQDDAGVSFLVISSRNDPAYSTVETLACGKPGSRTKDATAVRFEMPSVRSELIFEAYYASNRKEPGRLTFSW